MFRRYGIYCCEDATTGNQASLRTRDEGEAILPLHARNESTRQPVLNLQLAHTYLAASDSQIATRTWRQALDSLIAAKHDSTQERCQTAARNKALASLLPLRHRGSHLRQRPPSAALPRRSRSFKSVHS